jgi:hypothetical protein
MKHTEEHTKTYRGLENGAGQIVCSCGFETPAVDDSSAFTLGRKQRSVESYFEEHLATVGQVVETQMVAPDQQQTVTPAQRPQAKRRK